MSPVLPRRPSIAVLLLMLFPAGCAGRDQRPRLPPAVAPRPAALVLDGALAHPSVHRSLLARLAAAGLDPTYRRFDPRLGDEDVDRHEVVVWLAHRVRGSQGSLAVQAAEVDLAARFVERGGKLILGVLPGSAVEGAEGRAFQAVLDRLGVPIVIEPHEVVDLAPEVSYPAALFRAALLAPDPGHLTGWGLPPLIVGERAAPLRVGPRATALLWSPPTSFLDRLYGPTPTDPSALGRRVVTAVGAAGNRGGRVLVTSRLLLDAGGTPIMASADPLLPDRLPPGALEGRERFLRALLEEFVWGAGVGERGAGAAGPGSGLRRVPGEDTAPAPVSTGATVPGRCGAWRPGEAWVEQEGLKAGWGYVDRPDAEVEALLRRLPASGLNALWGPARWGGLAWPARDPAAAAAARVRLARVESGLGGTGVRWLAGIDVPGQDANLDAYPRAVAIGGREVALPSPVDARFWDEQIVPQIQALAARAGKGSPLAGVLLDLEMYGRPVLYYGDAFDFGDGPFLAFLDEAAGAGSVPGSDRPVPGSLAGHEAARRLQAGARGDWLLATGQLPAYYAWLGRQAEAIGRRLRAALDAAAPPGRDLVLGFYAVGLLPAWFYQGLWRGASAGGRPVLLFTFQVTARAELGEREAEGICARHALAALLGLVGRDGLAPVLARAGREHDGFWLNRITTLVAPPALFEAVETPVGVEGEAAWHWIADGVKAYVEARRGLHKTSAEGGR